MIPSWRCRAGRLRRPREIARGQGDPGGLRRLAMAPNFLAQDDTGRLRPIASFSTDDPTALPKGCR